MSIVVLPVVMRLPHTATVTFQTTDSNCTTAQTQPFNRSSVKCVFIDGDYSSLSSPGKDTGTVSGNLVQESARVIKEVSHLNTSSVT